MPLKKGEVYRCPKESCGCEVTVTKSARPHAEVRKAPRAAADVPWS